MEKNGTSKNPTIPKDFKPINTADAKWVKGTGDQTDYDKGLVIEDRDGNQFVWVPCYVKDAEGADTSVTEYKQHVYAGTAEKKNDTNLTTDSGEGGWKTQSYTMYGANWKDDASTYGVTSVKEYGGFWIGRYEAGIPENASFYSTGEDGDNYVFDANKKNVTKETKDGEGEVKLKPVSKKGYFSWNFVSQQKAVELSKQMYEGNDSIDSKLIDSYAWDTVTQWIADKETDSEGKKIDVTSSSKYGNYLDNGSDYTGAYAVHLWVSQKQAGTGNSGWIFASNITNGPTKLEEKMDLKYSDVAGGRYDQTNIASGYFNETESSFNSRVEIPTGNYEGSKLQNIYDLAGNMWEVTTEVGDHNTDYTETENNKADITR